MLRVYNIELTADCNLAFKGKCKFCPMDKHILYRDGRVMSYRDLYAIRAYVDKYLRAGFNQSGIWLNNMGENLLVVDTLREALTLFKDIGPVFATNGSLLERIQNIPEEFTYAKFIQVDCEEYKNPNWNSYVQQVKRLAERGIPLVLVGMSDMKEERKRLTEELVLTLNQSYPQGFNFLLTPVHNWHGSMGKWSDMIGDQVLWDKYEECPVSKYGWITVLSDGTVVTCCLCWEPENSLVLGSLNDLFKGKIQHKWPYKACNMDDKDRACHMVFATETSPVGSLEITKRYVKSLSTEGGKV